MPLIGQYRRKSNERSDEVKKPVIKSRLRTFDNLYAIKDQLKENIGYKKPCNHEEYNAPRITACNYKQTQPPNVAFNHKPVYLYEYDCTTHSCTLLTSFVIRVERTAYTGQVREDQVIYYVSSICLTESLYYIGNSNEEERKEQLVYCTRITRWGRCCYSLTFSFYLAIAWM